MSMGFRDNPNNILGADSADNQFASTNVAANADGSIIERQEAIKDQITALNADVGDASARTNLQSIMAMLGNPDTAGASIYAALAGAAGIPAFPTAAAPANDVSLAEVLRDIWDVLRNGTGGTEPGTNKSVIDCLREYGRGNIVSKTITYSGAASYNAFTVTGLVGVKVIGYITTPLSNDAATTSVGTATSAAGLIAATAGTAMQTANQVWTDNAPTKFETFPANTALIGAGETIVVDGDVNLAAGVVTLYCWWFPISSDGNVVAA